jgi:hypothetical protein
MVYHTNNTFCYNSSSPDGTNGTFFLNDELFQHRLVAKF